MMTKNVPNIKSVTATKEGRFWAVKTDGKLLAIVLYKGGALAVQQLLQRLAGLPVDEAEAEKPVASKDQNPKAAGKNQNTGKTKAAGKTKPPQKSSEKAPQVPSSEPGAVPA